MTLTGAPDATSVQQSTSTMKLNSSIMGREAKVGLRSALHRNNIPNSHHMSVSSHNGPDGTVYSLPIGEVYVKNPLNYQPTP